MRNSAAQESADRQLLFNHEQIPEPGLETSAPSH
jgi:hypothetical protein